MRTALTGLATLHGLTLVVVAWLYASGDTPLAADARAYGGAMLLVAGLLTLLGGGTARARPVLGGIMVATGVPLIAMAWHGDHLYLVAYMGWSLALAVGMVALAIGTRRAGSGGPGDAG